MCTGYVHDSPPYLCFFPELKPQTTYPGPPWSRRLVRHRDNLSPADHRGATRGGALLLLCPRRVGAPGARDGHVPAIAEIRAQRIRRDAPARLRPVCVADHLLRGRHVPREHGHLQGNRRAGAAGRHQGRGARRVGRVVGATARLDLVADGTGRGRHAGGTGARVQRPR